jgi:hypothetical protein
MQDNAEIVNLEHILPEKPGDNYPKFTAEQVASFWKRIGNMVLIRNKDNSDLRSAPFPIKAATYKGCPYVLTSQVATVEDWTVDTIRDRQRVLAKLALTAWPV